MINESKLDRVIRFIVGIVFITSSILWLQSTLKIVFLIVGLISLITSLTGFCFLYKIFGINTINKRK